jgi:hypothetical protein
MWRVLAFLLIALPAAAQQPPACYAGVAGAVACMSGKLCACEFQRGGSVSGRPDGWRWNCGALRPSCGEALAPPGLGQSPMLPMPELYMQIPPPGMRPR